VLVRVHTCFARGLIAIATLALMTNGVLAAVFNINSGDVNGANGLKAAIVAARANHEDDTINLAAGAYLLSVVDNSSAGATGLPAITSDSGHTITINGNGATIQRSTASGTPEFRLLLVDHAHVIIDAITFDNGRASGPNVGQIEIANAGGGVLNREGDLTITNSTFTRCVAVVGGGLCNSSESSTAHLAVRACTFNSNNGHGDTMHGGGLANAALGGGSANATAENATFADNFALLEGSGVVSYASGGGKAQLDMTGCTFSDQFTGSEQAHSISAVTADNFSSAAATMSNSILRTTVLDGGELTVSGNATSLTSRGYNLTNGSSDGVFVAPGDAISADPRLGLLGMYGGQVPTFPLIAGSPAIDAGDPALALATDARGKPRPADGNKDGKARNDIGAFERQPSDPEPSLVVTTVADHDDGACDASDCTLREAINAANAAAGDDFITFTPNVTGNISVRTQLPDITSNVTIYGPGANLLTIHRLGFPEFRVFRITKGSGDQPNVTISGLTISNGKRSQDIGGGILNDHGQLTLVDCVLSGNSASVGAGIYNSGGGTGSQISTAVTLMNCTLSGNISTNNGGALFNDGVAGRAYLFLTNCTLSGNSAGGEGGAMDNAGTSNGQADVNINNSTIAGNSGLSSVYTDAPFGPVCYDSIFSSSSGVPNFKANSGSFISVGHNISTDKSQTFFNANKGDKSNTDPKLDNTLKLNGGTTPTLALLTTSPAIDNADPANSPARDQRHFVRHGSIDIGAFEFSGTPPIPPSVTTAAATNIGTTSAKLNAAVNPNGSSTAFFFNSDFQQFNQQVVGSGTGDVPVSVNVTGLTPAKTYHFNVVASNPAGAAEGIQRSFTTLPAATPTPTPKQTPVPTPQATPTPKPTPTPTTTPSSTATPSPTPHGSSTPTPTPARSTLGNISTRLRVETGDNVLIGGFIITGTQPKKVILRAIGPSLPVSGALQNPLLELHSPNGGVTINDNWVDAPNKPAIIDTTVAPSNAFESAILTRLPANNSAYTAVVRGVGDGIGVGLVEVYDLDRSVDSELANISTRGLVQTGENVMIGGFIVLNGSQKVIVRAIGPSLPVQGKLLDPVLELHNGNGALLQSNDNWRTGGQQAEIIATNVPPSDDRESAIVRTLAPGNYTAIVRGVNDTTGVALVEVYAVN
jgi:CSLREA domain-containing protein